MKSAFASIDPKVKLRWNHKLNYPGMIRGKLSPPSSEKPEQIARQFFYTHKDLLQLEDIEGQLKLVRVKTDSVGNSRSYFHQLYKGIPL